MKIYIKDRDSAEDSNLHEKPHIIISIIDPIYKDDTDRKARRRPIPFRNEYTLDVLYLDFADMVPPNPLQDYRWEEYKKEHGYYPYYLFTTEQAKLIKFFVELYKDRIDEMIIHCAAGISRSPAVGKALLEHYVAPVKQQESFICERRISPNEWVYKTMKEVL